MEAPPSPLLATRFNGAAWYRRVSLVDITFWRPENEPLYTVLARCVKRVRGYTRTRSPAPCGMCAAAG